MYISFGRVIHNVSKVTNEPAQKTVTFYAHKLFLCLTYNNKNKQYNAYCSTHINNDSYPTLDFQQ